MTDFQTYIQNLYNWVFSNKPTAEYLRDLFESIREWTGDKNKDLPTWLDISLNFYDRFDTNGGCVTKYLKNKIWAYLVQQIKKMLYGIVKHIVDLVPFLKPALKALEYFKVFDFTLDGVSKIIKLQSENLFKDTDNKSKAAGLLTNWTITTISLPTGGILGSIFSFVKSVMGLTADWSVDLMQFSLVKSIKNPVFSMFRDNIYELELARCFVNNMLNGCGTGSVAKGVFAAGGIWFLLSYTQRKLNESDRDSLTFKNGLPQLVNTDEEKWKQYQKAYDKRQKELIKEAETEEQSRARNRELRDFMTHQLSGGEEPPLRFLKDRIVALESTSVDTRGLRVRFNSIVPPGSVRVHREPISYYGLADVELEPRARGDPDPMVEIRLPAHLAHGTPV